jgi:Zn-dependent peptidase ImmA (M78 family)
MNYSRVNINAENIASAVYDAIGSLEPSIYELLVWMEDNFGIRIKVNSGNSQGFHMISGLAGLEYYDPSINAYRIWYRNSDCEYRQNFTIVHEIAHILRNSPKTFGFSDGDIYNKDEEERFCNRFSAAFLMPKDLFIEKWNAAGKDITFKKVRMTSIFKVSGEAVYYRARELKLI